jgi:hypothetical protein
LLHDEHSYHAGRGEQNKQYDAEPDGAEQVHQPRDD